MIDCRRAAQPRRLPHAVLAICMGLSLAACTAGPPAKTPGAGSSTDRKLADLERRAVDRWQLLIDGKPDQAYEYLTPGFRTTVSQQEYARNAHIGTLKWQSASWRDAECSSADACEARVLIGYSVRMAGAGDVASVNLQKESWLKVDGEWYFLPKP